MMSYCKLIFTLSSSKPELGLHLQWYKKHLELIAGDDAKAVSGSQVRKLSGIICNAVGRCHALHQDGAPFFTFFCRPRGLIKTRCLWLDRSGRSSAIMLLQDLRQAGRQVRPGVTLWARSLVCPPSCPDRTASGSCPPRWAGRLLVDGALIMAELCRPSRASWKSHGPSCS